VTGVSGLVKPGHRVDIFYTRAVKSGDQQGAVTETMLLLENVGVHAIDAQTIHVPTRRDQRQRNYSTLTLSVTPQEAAVLTQASREGVITFTIRAKEDFRKLQNLSAVDHKNLSSLARKANAERWKKAEIKP
jgi:Flp pilus assembly protein CpaB